VSSIRLVAAALAVTLIPPALAFAQGDPRPATNATVNEFGVSSHGVEGKSSCWNGRAYRCIILKGSVRVRASGTTVEITCQGGKARGCPSQLRGGKSKTVTAVKSGWVSVNPALSGNRLRKGAKVNFKFTDPGARYYRAEASIFDGRWDVHFRHYCEGQDGTEARMTGDSCK
jgi:hypothetical protein